jgi:hypothetical protein
MRHFAPELVWQPQVGGAAPAPAQIALHGRDLASAGAHWPRHWVTQGLRRRPQLRAYMEHLLGVDEFGKLNTVLAKPPLETCLRVNTLQSTPQASAPQTSRRRLPAHPTCSCKPAACQAGA